MLTPRSPAGLGRFDQPLSGIRRRGPVHHPSSGWHRDCSTNSRPDITAAWFHNKEGITMKHICGLALIGLLVASPGWARTSGNAAEELIKVENAWKQAVVTRDAVALERLYADEYLSTDQEGVVWDKARDIAIDTTGGSRLASFKLDDLTV